MNGPDTASAASRRLPLPELALATLVLGTIALLVTPLPPPVLDFALAANLAAAVITLLVTLSLRQPLHVTAFPALLLITTLLRLGLNVSSTRLILSQAYAGEVIDGFAGWVVGGNLIVGAVIFLILTVIQFVVIARGGERVAEVSARFALDAMPGRQMSIDADLRSGAISLPEAREARARLTRESRLYGAMDGAMKFVKGDAIAGLIILAIDLLGGVAIGTLQLGMSLPEALQRFGILTIGDGLVSQIPALLIATSAALVVTRVASAHDDPRAHSLGHELFTQLGRSHRPLLFAAALLLLFALLPGLPALPFALLAIAISAAGLLARRAAPQPPLEATQSGPPPLLTLSLPPDLEAPLAATLDAIRQDTGLPLDDAQFTPSPDSDAHILVDGFPSARLPQPNAEDVERALRALLPDLLTLQQVERMLQRWRGREPQLVDALVPRHISLLTLTRVLRALLDDGLNLGQLRPVLEALLTQPADADLDALHDAARAALQGQLSRQLEASGRALIVVGPGISGMLTSRERVAPSVARDILAALDARLTEPPEAGWAFAIASPSRRALARIVAPEHPDAPIYGLDEIAEHTPREIVDIGR